MKNEISNLYIYQRLRGVVKCVIRLMCEYMIDRQAFEASEAPTTDYFMRTFLKAQSIFK
jgi:hypothetical protein